MLTQIAAERLHNQHLARGSTGTPADLVARFGAVQAQEYLFAKWGLSLRLARATADADLDADFAAGRILRTHAMRSTWHFVTPDDIRWMLKLTGPRVHRTLAGYLRREEVDRRMLTRAMAVFERALGGGNSLTRAELAARLARAGITASGMRLGFIMIHAELEAIICSGPRKGKQFTYALASERAPKARRLSRDEALAELARRYFTSHAPATVRDFSWWSGLTMPDARLGLELIGAKRETVDGLDYYRAAGVKKAEARELVHLLPIYDEYLIAYRDRVAVPHGPGTIRTEANTVAFRHALVAGGEVAGSWNVKVVRNRCAVEVTPLRRLSPAEKRGVEAAAERYGRFLGSPTTLSIAGR